MKSWQIQTRYFITYVDLSTITFAYISFSKKLLIWLRNKKSKILNLNLDERINTNSTTCQLKNKNKELKSKKKNFFDLERPSIQDIGYSGRSLMIIPLCFLYPCIFWKIDNSCHEICFKMCHEFSIMASIREVWITRSPPFLWQKSNIQSTTKNDIVGLF